MSAVMPLKYRRILLKLSGEALSGASGEPLDPAVLDRLAGDLRELAEAGARMGLVIGGGNLFRGVRLARGGMNRVSADHMGMLATLMNSLALGAALQGIGVSARVFSALRIDAVCEFFTQRAALTSLEAGEIVIIAGGTGNPYFTTDSAASLRGIELGMELLIKATKVNGVYSADPVLDPSAEFLPRLTFDAVLERRLEVMDATAIALCRDNRLPLRVVNIFEPRALPRVAAGEDLGTLVETG